MKKIYFKLIVVALQLLLAVSLLVMSSYAWMVLASNPVAEGIQITIGGGNTILVAADLAQEADGTVYHYPGAFSDTLNFSQNNGYDYLNELSNLTPVSTADGINWFIPTYYNLTDPEVKDGSVLSGSLKPVEYFIRDIALNYANLPADKAEEAAQGSYAYLDFWVVSPGQDYTLRVSAGEDGGGSYVVALPQAKKTDNGYTLTSEGNNAAACVRVGVLANPDELVDNTMWYYQSSADYATQYTRLRGAYQEAGEEYLYSDGYRFTIYEPNGDVHPTNGGAEGTYLETRPVGLINGMVEPVSVEEKLTVQKGSDWAAAQIGEGTQLEQRFQTAILEPSFRGLETEDMSRKFYSEYLAAQVAPYVKNGLFIKKTGTLYDAMNAVGTVSADFLGEGYTAGATDDVYIVKLEKNVPQRIRLFIWLEGQDADCVNSASASAFAFRIELAGSNQDLESVGN